MADQNPNKYLDKSLGNFLTVLDIIDDESANLTFRSKEWRNQYCWLKFKL